MDIDTLILLEALISRVEALEAAHANQADINVLVTDQIVSLDARANEASEGLRNLQRRSTMNLGKSFDFGPPDHEYREDR